jgi:general secretion pathway protein D
MVHRIQKLVILSALWLPLSSETPLNSQKELRIRIDFENEDLTNIIDLYAEKTGKNIILPQGPLALNQKVTFSLPEKVPLKTAENYIRTFVELAGYTMRTTSDTIEIVKLDQNSTRSPLPLFINVAPEQLPPNQLIRAIYYLANLKVPENVQGADPLTLVLRDVLSQNAQFSYDPKSNGIIIADNSSAIGAAMATILGLDASGSPDTVITVPLYNAVAQTVADLIKASIVGTTPDTKGAIRTDVKSEAGIYFASNTRVVADNRRNAIILMGKESAVSRLRDFIREYLDAPQDSGKSILHSYDLQYLDAEEFAKVLQDIVAARGIGGQSQKDISGPTQFFEGVKVIPEVPRAVQAAKNVGASTDGGTVFRGGNRLIIAARKKDWIRIKALIEQLDKPQRQVIIEVMIVDLTLTDNKILASQTRTPSGLGFPKGFEFQSAQIIGPILDNTATTPATTLNADLLRILLGNPPDTSLAARTSSGADTGSLIISLNDPNGSGVWSVIKLLDKYVETKILSHPFLVTLNNVHAEETLTTIRRARGDQSVGEGAVSTIRQKDFEAKLKVSVTPRVSSLERVNMEVLVDIEDFTSPNIEDFTRVTRRVQTNANLSTGQMLVLGGLSILREQEGASGTPILKDIPFFGWLFKNNNRILTRTNLGIFIAPTVIEPKLRQGQRLYTEDKVARGRSNVDESKIFRDYHDPITRWFFIQDGQQGEVFINEYLADAKDGREMVDEVGDGYKLVKREPRTSDEGFEVSQESAL